MLVSWTPHVVQMQPHMLLCKNEKKTLMHIVIITHCTILYLGTIRHILDVQNDNLRKKEIGSTKVMPTITTMCTYNVGDVWRGVNKFPYYIYN
jgi:hypothetical protein